MVSGDLDLERQEAGLLFQRMRTLDLVVAGDEEIARELRQGREVEVEVAVAMAVAEGGVSSGSDAFRGGHGAVCGGDGGGGRSRSRSSGGTAFVVTPLVSTKSLATRKSLVADGALVRLTGSVGGSGGGGGGGCCGGRRRLMILAAAAAFPVAGLVSAESLVG